jgi:hypothetical protein
MKIAPILAAGAVLAEGAMADLPNVLVTIEPELVDKPTTCQMLGGISEDRLERFMRAGEIVPRLIGQRVVFSVEEVRRFARSLPSWKPRRPS